MADDPECDPVDHPGPDRPLRRLADAGYLQGKGPVQEVQEGPVIPCQTSAHGIITPWAFILFNLGAKNACRNCAIVLSYCKCCMTTREETPMLRLAIVDDNPNDSAALRALVADYLTKDFQLNLHEIW